MKIKLLTTTVFFFLAFISNSQDFSNKGKEFWLAYSYHVGMKTGGAPVMTLYITSDVTTGYTVEIFGVATIQSGTINAGQVQTVVIPNSYFISDEGTFTNKSIRVTADQPVVVYSYITRASASAATLCLPTPVLGREYYSSNFTQNSNEDFSNSYVTIVAVEDNSTIEITPSANTKNGWVAGSTYSVTLNKGQVYQILGKPTTAGGGTFKGEDLSGTHIKSVANSTGGCKRIAVFSGSGKIFISTNPCSQTSSDNLYQQLYPLVSWGLKYLTVPSASRPNNIYRITKADPATNVYLNGTLVPAASFTNGRFYQFNNNTPNVIVADKPISVAQYFTTQNCDGNINPYDPDMIILNPVEQNIDKVTLISSNLVAQPSAGNPHIHNIHVIMKNGGTGISTFKLDGNLVSPASWQTHPGDPAYSYVYLSNISQGYHRIESDSGFNAIAYGYANAESYGYSAGANVKDLYQFASIKNQFSTVDFPSACTESPFYFRMTFPYQPTELKWMFGSALNAMGFKDTTIANPTYDSTYVKNGRQIYRYTLPNTYTINTPGTYPVKIIAQNPTPEGCSGEQEINFDLQVFNRPKADFTFTGTNFCAPDQVKFADASNTGGRSVIKYIWNVSDGRTSSIKDPQFAFNTPATYNVDLTVITDIGCIAETVTKPIEINPVPTANFDLNSSSCETNSVLFKDLSTLNSSNVTEWKWTFGDGSATVINNSGASVAHTFAAAGTYSVTLDLKTDKSCASTFTKTVVVHPLPKPSFEVPGICLKDVSATFTNTTTIADGTQSSINYKWTFNGANPNNSTAVHPTTSYSAAGTYTVSLEATSVNGCKNSVSQPFTINGSQPKSAFSIQGGNEHCSNKTVTVQNNSTVDIGKLIKLEIFWNDGVDPADQTVSLNPASGATYSKTYPEFGAPATKTYKIRVRAYSGASCFNEYSETLTLKATPQVVFGTVNPVCANAPAFQINSATTSNNFSGTGVFSGNGVSATGIFNPAVAGAGTHTVRYTFNGANGCSDSKQEAITIYPVPVVDAGADRFMLEGGNTTLLGSGSGAGLVYQWTPSTALSDPTIPQPVAMPTDDITYTLKVSSSDGCEASDDVFVKVLKAPTIPNVFTPNGDGTNDKWDIKYLETYPGAIIKVFNRYGQLVFESRGYAKQWDGTFNGKPLPAGTYYYIVDPKNGRKQIAGFVDIVR